MFTNYSRITTSEHVIMKLQKNMKSMTNYSAECLKKLVSKRDCVIGNNTVNMRNAANTTLWQSNNQTALNEDLRLFVI